MGGFWVRGCRWEPWVGGCEWEALEGGPGYLGRAFGEGGPWWGAVSEGL